MKQKIKLFFLVLSLLGGAAGVSARAATDVFTATGTWTAPAGVTSVDVEVWGGGGAGGGNPTNNDGGGGGGGGAYSRTTTITVTPGTTYTVTVGAGGVGVAGGDGGAGGDSWFISTATILARGGAGGRAPVAGAGGLGGAGGAAAAGVGTLRYSGGDGGTGRNNNAGRGGPGGSSAGTAANGTSGTNPWTTVTAAAAPTGGGIGGDGGTVDGLAPASGNGGGGGGSGDGSGPGNNRLGGDGAPGMVTITYASGSTGTVTAYPTLCVNDTSIGTQAWGGLTNVTAQDNTYATATASNSQITNYLKCTGYNFAIPSGATITGITVGPWVNATWTFTVNAMQLVKGDVIQPTNLAAGDIIPNGGGAMLPSPTQLLFGSSTNLWGNTWTAADINNATFGAAFAAQRGPFATTQTVGVDAMPITITYTTAGAGTVTAYPTLCVNDTSIGTRAWGGLTNVTAQDNAYATATASNSQITNYLKCTGYNFAIPSGATITGITSGPWVNATWTFTVNAMQLVKADVIQPTNLAVGDTIPNGGGAMLPAPTQLLFGGSTNLWGNTWTPTDINDATFGAAFAAQRGPYATTQTVGVDAMPITIDYTTSGGGTPTTVTYYHDTTNGVAIGVDGPTNVVSGTNVTIPPIITASLITANTCTGNARSQNHPTGLYTHSRWYLTTDYAVATEISANPTGSARLRGRTNNDTVTVSLYDYDSVSGAKTLIGSSAPITISAGTANYTYTITSPLYTVPAGHRLMLQYDFNQLQSWYRARVYCSSTNSYITVTETPVSGSLDHLEIQHASGTGLTCAASTLTIVACADAACTTPYTSGVTGTLSATGTPTVNWDGTTGGAAGAGFVIPSGSSSVTKNVQVATSGSVVFGVSSPTPAPTNSTTCNFGSPACTFTANTAGFLFSNTTTGAAYIIPAQVSGTATGTLYLRAVQASTTNPAICTPAIIGQTTGVTMGYTCNNPASCQAGNLATITNVTTAAATAIAPGGTSVTLNFDANGSAPITVRYDDVGQITLNANKTVTPFGGATDITLVGTSNAFVVAPHHFGFSGVTAGPISAGNSFSATVTAYNNLATPTATPNFGQETTPEGATLSFTRCQPTGTSAVNGTFSGSVGTFTSGAASSSNLNWSEVGNGDLVATLTSGSYLSSGLTVTGNTSTSGTVCQNPVGTPVAGNVGNFIPDHFDTIVTGPMTCPTGLACPSGGLVYSGQSFTTNVYARNAAGAITQNYDGTTNTSPNFSRAVTLSAWDGVGSTTTQNPPSASGSSITAGGTIAANAFSQGSTVSGTPGAPVYTFGTTPTDPTDIYMRAVDTDLVTSLTAASNEGGVTVVNGRIKVSNAYGSELLPLTLSATAQYYTAIGWTNSTTDSITNLTLASPYTVGAGTSVATFVAPTDAICLLTYSNGDTCKGVATINLAIPSAGGGVATVSPGAPGYLPVIPGTATFGVYNNNNGFIYRRESY